MNSWSVPNAFQELSTNLSWALKVKNYPIERNLRWKHDLNFENAKKFLFPFSICRRFLNLYESFEKVCRWKECSLPFQRAISDLFGFLVVENWGLEKLCLAKLSLESGKMRLSQDHQITNFEHVGDRYS